MSFLIIKNLSLLQLLLFGVQTVTGVSQEILVVRYYIKKIVRSNIQISGTSLVPIPSVSVADRIRLIFDPRIRPYKNIK